MSRFIALHCGDESAALLANHPNAFLLLTQIAMRAKWRDCSITRLKAGQAFIGDWKEAGIHSEMAYRHAKAVLSECGLATFKGTNKGTIAALANSMVFSISPPSNNGQGNDPTTNKERSSNGQGTTNHTDTQSTQSTQTPLALELDNSSSPERLDDSNRVTNGAVDALAESIYREYPRKVSKKPALKAIKIALKKNTGDFLLEKTKTFAEMISWKESQFIPHPATWFGQERFNDDPSDWEQPPAKGPRAPVSEDALEAARKSLGRRAYGLETDHRQAKAAREYPEPARTKLPRL